MLRWTSSKLIAGVLALILTAWVLWRTQAIVTPLILGVLIVCATRPLLASTRLSQRAIPVMAGLGAVAVEGLAWLGLTLAPIWVQQLNALVLSVLDYLDLTGALGPIVNLPLTILERPDITASELLGLLIVLPVVVYYGLVSRSADLVNSGVLGRNQRDRVAMIAQRFETTLTMFLHRQLIPVLVLTTLYGLVFTALNLPHALALASVVGLASIAPGLGFLIGAAALLCLLATRVLDGVQVLTGLAVLGAGQVVFVLMLNRLRARDRVHPLLVLVAALMGGQLLGLAGALMGITGAAWLTTRGPAVPYGSTNPDFNSPRQDDDSMLDLDESMRQEDA